MRALDVLQFCKNHLSPVLTEDSTLNSVHIKRLKGPYIKVEDNRLQHRPIYKEFYEWPQINNEFHEFLCPFVKRKVQKEGANGETVESLEGLAVNNNINEKLTNTLTNNITTNTITTTNNEKNKLKQNTSQKNQLLVKKSLNKKRKTPAYCEICGTDYEDLTQVLFKLIINFF